MATSFSSLQYANAISCKLKCLLVAGHTWGVPGEGNLPFLRLGESKAVPLVENMGNNTKNRQFDCRWQVHLAQNLPQATHTQNRVTTT